MTQNIKRPKARLTQLALLLVMAIFINSRNPSAAAQTAVSSPDIHHTAANFSRMDLSHRKVELIAYRGKVILLNFWATWCGPCLIEMPTFVEWQKQYGPERFQVLGVSMDDAIPAVRTTTARLKLNYPVVMGDEKLGAAYGGILGLPVTFLIDRDGKIRARYQGATDLKSIDRDIQSLLVRH